MPYEKKIISDLFDDSDIKSILDNYNYNYNNHTYPDKIYDKKKCSDYQNKLDNSNAKLFDKCLIYIIIINILLLLLFIFDAYQNYNTFCSLIISPKNQKYTPTNTPTNIPTPNSKSSLISFKSSQNIQNDYKKNDNEFELVNISNNGTYIPTEKSQIQAQSNEYFIVYYYKNSQIVKEIYKLVQFIILVGIFEYLFFTLIVNKYKIANIYTILCNLIKGIVK
jgi:hypothetical protein